VTAGVEERQLIETGVATPGRFAFARKLFDGSSLANFETWLVDDHSSDPKRVFSVVDQIDGAPAIRINDHSFRNVSAPQAEAIA